LRLFCLKACLLGFQIRPALRCGRPEDAYRRFKFGERCRQRRVLVGAPREAQVAQPMAQALEAHRLGCLSAKASDLTAHFAHDVGYPREVLLGQGQLVHGFAPLALVARDPGGLFEYGAPLVGL
jgi:hypothetical protein